MRPNLSSKGQRMTMNQKVQEGTQCLMCEDDKIKGLYIG